MSPNNRIACWLSDKKSQKFNWVEFQKICNDNGYVLVKLDLQQDLYEQGPFCALLHKFIDIMALAKKGNLKHCDLLEKIEKYINANPSMIVVDPLPKVRQLIDRYNTYSIINSTNLGQYNVFTPNFCELNSFEIDDISKKLRDSGVTFPIICKPIICHGSREAHSMSIIFNEKYLVDCKTPCVAQSFINHNAVLHKIYMVGDKYFYFERPSLKNFDSSDRETIAFETADVSKADSQSTLTVLDPDDEGMKVTPDPKIMALMVRTLRKSFDIDLLGVDFVIENNTGKYAIIDVNCYPSYDGFPNIYQVLFNCLQSKIESSTEKAALNDEQLKTD